CPQALRYLRLKPGRKFCVLGRLASEVGWKYADIVEALEEKRKSKNVVFFKKVIAEKKLRRQAMRNVSKKIERYQRVIEAYGAK
ncbi:hypothetical protein, partial [Salmonella sp. s55044]|uniref:hypothetical protein n=1 Tax=Salmonella sp. s55044 TaxID=3159677 RepID=UPI00397F8634